MDVNKHAIACLRCAERKVRCNRQNPCNACISHKVECVFRTRKPAKRKQKTAKYGAALEQLKRYEALLRNQGVDPSNVEAAVEREQPRHSKTHPDMPKPIQPVGLPVVEVADALSVAHKPKLLQVQDGTKLVDNSLWYRVAQEIDEDEDYVENDAGNDSSDNKTSEGSFDYVLDAKTSTKSLRHPSPDILRTLWRTYRENVQPLTMLIHAPSFGQVIERVAMNIEAIPRGLEALLFAIYSMAVLSLTEDECKNLLSHSREQILRQYINATKAALSRAKFMSTTSLVVLQAAVLHLFAIRDTEEPRAVWSFTGLVMRISDAIGVNVDGTLLGLPPFETEMRRRIWWQLKAHDVRAAELAGQAKFLDFKLNTTSPHSPTNVDDSELSPTMTKAAVSSDRPTEMLWQMFRADLGEFASSVKARMQTMNKARLTQEEFGDMDDMKLKDKLTGEIVNKLEMKYLRFCDPTKPLEFFTLLGGRIAINVVKFMCHHPRRWARLRNVPDSEREYVWDVSIQLLSLYNMQQTATQLHHFAWVVPYHIQWHAVIHVLDTIRADPFHSDAAKGWELIDATYNNNFKMLLRVDRPIYVAVGNLCLKTFDACVAKNARSLTDTPAYVARLREQREAARARQQNKPSKRSSAHQVDRADASEGIAPGQDHFQPQMHATAEMVSLADSSARGPYLAPDPDYAFWLGTAMDGGLFTDAADLMDLDTSYGQVPNSWFDFSDDQGMNWAQWDDLFSGGQLGPNTTARGE